MNSESAVDRLYRESTAVLAALATEPSLQSSAGDNLRKALLLAAASNFEYKVTQLMLEFVAKCSNGSRLFTTLVGNQVVRQKYHTWFDWECTNANKFFSMFGQDFKTRMVALLKQRDDLREATLAFLEIGSERNRLVHQDFATFPLDKTLDEIYARYKQAIPFIEMLPEELHACDQATRTQ